MKIKNHDQSSGQFNKIVTFLFNQKLVLAFFACQAILLAFFISTCDYGTCKELESVERYPRSISEIVGPVDSKFVATYEEIIKIGHNVGINNVLIVFDLDNTLLAMDQDLGSDQWFNWQRNMDAASPQKIAELNEAQSLLFGLSQMHLTDMTIYNAIKELQDRGYRMIVMTARGTENRNATERVLAINGLNFKRSAIPPEAGYGGTYPPYDPNDLPGSGFGELCAKSRSDFSWPREVSYQNGVYMVAGQDKGIMLRSLLYKTGQIFNYIFFFDDSPTNIKNIEDAFSCLNATRVQARLVDVEKNAVDRFNAGDKSAVASQFQRIRGLLRDIFKRNI